MGRNAVRYGLCAAIAVLAAGVVTPASAEEKSVTGELVTIMCYTGHGEKGRGEAHVSCAVKCARQGYPLAVLTGDGVMYEVTGRLTANHNEQLQPLLAKTVVATGEVGQEGKEKTLDASSIVEAK